MQHEVVNSLGTPAASTRYNCNPSYQIHVQIHCTTWEADYLRMYIHYVCVTKETNRQLYGQESYHIYSLHRSLNLLFYYLANKRSLHVRSQNLEISTLIEEK